LKEITMRVDRNGFTLIEVLVVIGVVGVLLALLLPAIQQARETARRGQCANNIRQLGLALHNYHDAHEVFPPGAILSNELSWHVFVLPMLDQGTLYSQFNFDQGQYFAAAVNNKNNPHGLTKVPQYLCPSGTHERSLTSADAVDGQKTYTTHYYGIMGPRGDNPTGGTYELAPGYGPFSVHGILGYESSKGFTDITDGASATFVVGEISWNDANGYRTWVRGVNGNPMSGAKNVLHPINTVFYGGTYRDDGNASGFNDISLGSEHPGGTHVLMGDGAVRFVSETVDMVLYKNTASIDGGEAETLE
jgi:prepilin-type N-terminal cleavage/methylation domain-containing protein